MNFERPYTQRMFSLSQERHIPPEVLAMTQDQFMRDYPIEELAQWECELTQDMEKLVNEFNTGYKRLVAQAGVKPFVVGLDRVHIIPVQMYQKYVSAILDPTIVEQAQGMSRNGHLYVVDNLGFVDFLVRFSHEYIHLQAFTKQVMRVVQNERPWEKGALYSPIEEVLRNSVLVAKSDGQISRHYGTGLDEGIVELLALELRRSTHLPPELPPKVTAFLTARPTTYLGQVAILQDVVKHYLHEQLSLKTSAFKDLIRLHACGDPVLLQRLSKAMTATGQPTALKTLFRMDVSIESAEETRHLLGL